MAFSDSTIKTGPEALGKISLQKKSYMQGQLEFLMVCTTIATGHV